MADRDAEYVLVRSRKPKKSRLVYYDDDGTYDDDDNEAYIYTRPIGRKSRIRQRKGYYSNDEFDTKHEPKQIDNPKIRIKNMSNGDRAILDEDDNIIKIMHGRSPSPVLVENRRLKYRPRQSHSVVYEVDDDHFVQRPMRKKTLPKAKNQLVYVDDEPKKIIRKVIIDPQTGDRETVYEKERPKKQKYIVQQCSPGIIYESDDGEVPIQNIKAIKHRSIPIDVLPKYQTKTKHLRIRNNIGSEPIYTISSKMPAIKSNRRIVYEVPTKRTLPSYVYSSGERYYK